MKKLLISAVLMHYLFSNAQTASKPPAIEKAILINNVQIFNGKDEKTITGNVLIVGNLISKISTSPIITTMSTVVTTIDGKGKFLCQD